MLIESMYLKLVKGRKSYVFVALLAVYAWAMALGYSSLHSVHGSPKALSQQWYQLDDTSDGFQHTLPAVYSDYINSASENNQHLGADSHIVAGLHGLLHPMVSHLDALPIKSPNGLINKNKANLLYPFHFFF
ncbi:hypothetical protein LCL86_02825 [Muricauda ruestringensis]|uniref:hypothetical protein n=1 Tax=Flagellimonas ruestringensis TaxID=111501 RepID=UPI001CD2FD30|nr:hypothetical protein [Allomuricauda ruestringensis]MCA0957962.1 hypothetical protein [Allomuricauda ruestringensis]